jgi:thiamine-monophosphate kinase
MNARKFFVFLRVHSWAILPLSLLRWFGLRCRSAVVFCCLGISNHLMPGEFEFLEWIRSTQTPSELVRVGIGDDLAALNWPKDDVLLVGVDQVLDGVHFDSKIHSPRAIGQKAMNRNLSDCAAMACLPAAAVAAVALPRGAGEGFARELYLGMKEAGDVFDCVIVGGDTGTWDGKLVLTVTILGRSGGIKPVTRSGAKVGDLIYVTGPLGGSLAGRHMTFEPRIKLARELANFFEIHAMIDLSDGLSRDLRHICQQSGVGALIDSRDLPLHEDIRKIQRNDWSPAEHAVHDGEDYELLFTCPTCDHPSVFPIGRITEDRAIQWVSGQGVERLEPKAWEHVL